MTFEELGAVNVPGGKVAGAGLGAAGGLVGIIGAVKQAKALARASRQAEDFEDFKFGQFFRDALDAQARTTASNNQTYATRGVDFRHGSPLAVAVDVANETNRNVERARQEAEMRKQQIRLDAEAGRASSIVSGISSGINAGSRVASILGTP